MEHDWQAAFERCPPYGEGAGAYGSEDVKLLAEMERSMECLLRWLETEGVYHLNQYLTATGSMSAASAVITITAACSTVPGRPWMSGWRNTARRRAGACPAALPPHTGKHTDRYARAAHGPPVFRAGRVPRRGLTCTMPRAVI